jgi:hypothetical protein
MDADLAVMRSVDRYTAVVDDLLAPLLKRRTVVGLAVKVRTALPPADPDGSLDDAWSREDIAPTPDVDARDRREALWAIGDLCVKYTLTRRQLRQLAFLLDRVAGDTLELRQVRRVMHDMFAGRYDRALADFVERKADAAIDEPARPAPPFDPRMLELA